jgi:hypothetical protein
MASECDSFERAALRATALHPACHAPAPECTCACDARVFLARSRVGFVDHDRVAHWSAARDAAAVCANGERDNRNLHLWLAVGLDPQSSQQSERPGHARWHGGAGPAEIVEDAARKRARYRPSVRSARSLQDRSYARARCVRSGDNRDAAALGHRAPDCGNPRVISRLASAARASHDVGERALDGR